MIDKPRRSRTAWPGPMSVAGVEPGHDHELPKPLVQRVRRLTLAVVIVGGCLAAIVALLLLLILLRGDYRDRENQRTNDRINDKLCGILALLPADSPLADDMRAELDCTQPGRAFEDLSPEVQHQLFNGSGAIPPPTPAGPASTVGPPPKAEDGASTNRPPPTPMPAPTRPPEAPPLTTPPPPSPLEPITEPICDATGICLPLEVP